ncbi:transcriptional regulator, partial [Paenibacillus alvei]|nr:transcriptional regulator [Paenibacillus alvei]
MIFVDESTVKVGGVVLPGLFKSLEIKEDATVEEQEVEGKAAKPKQATGYEDAKVTLELTLDDSPKQTKLQKLAMIQKLFRKPGQSRPIMHQIVNVHTA